MLASWVSVAEAKDDVVEDMDTSEPNWAWFYLAECGRWHIFGVSTRERIFKLRAIEPGVTINKYYFT